MDTTELNDAAWEMEEREKTLSNLIKEAVQEAFMKVPIPASYRLADLRIDTMDISQIGSVTADVLVNDVAVKFERR